MDTWKFYDITHRGHVVCNPTSEEKLARLVDLVQLPTAARVVDIACGKGEFLIRLVEAYGVRGVGVDLSPFFLPVGIAKCFPAQHMVNLIDHGMNVQMTTDATVKVEEPAPVAAAPEAAPVRRAVK